MTLWFITESWHTDVSKISPQSKYQNESNTGSKNPKVMQGKLAGLEVRKPNRLLILALPLLCSVIFSKPQSFFGWSISKLLLSINYLERSFQHRQHTSLRRMLNPRCEEIWRPTVCSIMSPFHKQTSLSAASSPLVYLIPPDEVPRINRR